MASVKGVEMGILEDGTPFLSARGLSRLCGVAPSVISIWAKQYNSDLVTGRDRKIRTMLMEHNYHDDKLFVKTMHKGHKILAIPDAVCMSMLEYYAFESRESKPKALRNYRLLARGSLRAFIYKALGYDPGLVPTIWTQFHDRAKLNAAPDGYFIVFVEMSALVLEAIKGGLTVDTRTVPDISVGQGWATHWRKQGLEESFGPCIKADHEYPDYFPQSASNPQSINAFPEAALGDFRRWMREIYIPTKFPAYLQRKVKAGELGVAQAKAMLEQLEVKSIE